MYSTIFISKTFIVAKWKKNEKKTTNSNVYRFSKRIILTENENRLNKIIIQIGFMWQTRKNKRIDLVCILRWARNWLAKVSKVNRRTIANDPTKWIMCVCEGAGEREKGRRENRCRNGKMQNNLSHKKANLMCGTVSVCCLMREKMQICCCASKCELNWNGEKNVKYISFEMLDGW